MTIPLRYTGYISAIVLLLTIVSAAQAKYSGGTGEPNDPYQIATAADLIALGETPEDYGKHFILTADIDLDPNLPGGRVFDNAVIAPDVNEATSWFEGSVFTGLFDGNGHTIWHLTITGKDYLGLFGQLVSGAEVRNLGVVDVNITGSGSPVGGLVGSNGSWEAGGGTVTQCYSSGVVSGSWCVGGLVGSNESGAVTACYSTGVVNGDGDIGGLVGYNGGEITDSYAIASITANSSIGGIGGLVGTNGYWEGWFLGSNRTGMISNCYSASRIAGADSAGGLVGYNELSQIDNSFWDIEVSSLTNMCGAKRSGADGCDDTAGKTTVEMQDPNTFMAGEWDFVGQSDGPHDIWAKPAGGGYPVLWWQVPAGFGLPDFSGGTGEAGDPYMISRPEELSHIGHNPRLMSCHFKLVDNLDLTGFRFYPIGGGTDYWLAPTYSFRGVFDGDGHMISHLSIQGPGCLGLFGFLGSGAEVKDLGVVDVNIVGSGAPVGGLVGANEGGTVTHCYIDGAVTGKDNVGGLVGENEGNVSQCYSTGAVSGGGVVGGLGGYNGGTVTDSYSTGAVSGGYDVGGLVGNNYGAVTQCHSTGAVGGTEHYSHVGGLVGDNRGTVTQCYSTGVVNGALYVGGLVGMNVYGIVTQCHSSGVVSATSRVGGLIGCNYSDVTQCYSTGTVSGTSRVGGLVGENLSGTVTQCHNTGTVSGNDHVGGLAGYNHGDVTQCYSTGAVSGIDDVGGLVGYSDHWSEVTGCFWDIQTSGQAESAGGTGKTTAEMQTAKTFLDAGWDFVDETANGSEDIWKIAEGLDYPRLAWENYSGGTGEPNDPYQIATAADLIALGETPEDYGKHFILTADIDLDPNLPGRKIFDKAVIAPVQLNPWDEEETSFTGVFDGKGHVISRLTITGQDDLGLFGQLRGQARNLGVVDANVAGSGGEIGGLAGYVWPDAEIVECHSAGTVSAGGQVGGLVGDNGGAVTHCYSTGTVQGDSGVGGLVGANDGTVTQCYSTGTVNAKGIVGGLVGENWGAVTQCYCTGAVSATGEDVGGLAGYNTGAITNAYATGSVTGDSSVGGLVGENGYHIGTRSGRASGTVSYCYSRGAVSGRQQTGGLVGDNVYGPVIQCFWDTQTSGILDGVGNWDPDPNGVIGKPTAEMQTASMFLETGWDFVGETGNGTSEIWQMAEGGGYPVLAVFSGYAPPQLAGSGTLQDPYLISDPLELGAMVHYDPSGCYRLVSSLDLSGIRWGTAVIPRFDGTFDGNKLKISGLRIQGGGCLGLFGHLASGAEVRDLGVADVNVAGSGWWVGGLAWCNDGHVTRCYSTGKVSGGDYVGGLVGENAGAVTQCYSTSKVGGYNHVGGLVGSNWGAVTQCCSGGWVSSDGDIGVVGGLVGWNYGTVTKCYSPGAVSGIGRYVGGMVGYNHSGVVAQCYSTGAASGQAYVGGLVGRSLMGDVTECFWDIQTSGQATSDGGTGKTTAEMQTAKTFLEAGWDFVDETANGTEDIWWINEGHDYPRLWWEEIEQ